LCFKGGEMAAEPAVLFLQQGSIGASCSMAHISLQRLIGVRATRCVVVLQVISARCQSQRLWRCILVATSLRKLQQQQQQEREDIAVAAACRRRLSPPPLRWQVLL
jgi:hypothetical protein